MTVSVDDILRRQAERPAPVETAVLLRGADRRLLKEVMKALKMALADTPETLAAPERRDVLEEVLADVAEELGAKVQPVEPEPQHRTIKTVGGVEHKVRG
jgi:hypothetical protein